MPVVAKRLNEATHEERIATRLRVDEVGELGRRVARDVQCVGDEGSNVVCREVAQPNGVRRDLRRLNRAQQLVQRVPRRHFVRSICTDDEHMRAVRIGEDPTEHVERSHVGPLQIVEKEHERALGRRDRSHERLGCRSKPILHLGARRFGQRRERTEDAFKGRHKRNERRARGTERVRDPLARTRELFVALHEQGVDQATKRLLQCAVRNAAAELVELPFCEEAAMLDDRPIQLVNHGRLADARVAGHEHQLG